MESMAQLKEEFRQKASAANLELQCLMDGVFNTEIAIVAEAPGDREVDRGLPLVGGSGTKLWESVRKLGIDRRNVYITNVVKRQVAFGDDKRHPINRHELDTWSVLLRWELAQLPRLKHVLVLGNMALKALTGHDGITKWRGSVLLDVELALGKKVNCICTYNPAMVLREPKLDITFKFDLNKLKKVRDGQWSLVMPETLINPTETEVHDVLTWMDKHTSDYIAFDIETIGNETACFGFAADPLYAICINLRTRSENRYTLGEEIRIRQHIQQFYKRQHRRMVAQNNTFDTGWMLHKDKIRVPPIAMDTMLAHHVLYPQLPHNLGYLTTQYTTRPFYKDEKDEWREKTDGDIDDFWRYNGQDCCNTHAVATAIHSELKAQSLDKFFYEHVMHAQPYLIEMGVAGVKVDTVLKENLKETFSANVDRLLTAFYSAVADATGDSEYEPNPNSPRQLSELLFSKLKLVGRGVSTNAENRERMYAHPATTEPKRAVIRALNEYAKARKFYSTYATSAIDDDGRMRFSYSQIGVQSAPGRLSSSGVLWRNKDGEQVGMNMQNQPDAAEPMYIADQGYGIGYFDCSQAEARLVAYFAKIESWIEQFERARLNPGTYDAHRALAATLYNIPYDDVPKKDRDENGITIRYIAKRARHGLNYRMMPDRLSSTAGIPLVAANDVYKKYHKLTPELQRWWADLEKEVRTTRTLYNAYGRRLLILERLTPEALESIVAFKPQSTLGDHVVRCIYKSQEDDRWPVNARMWLNIHDALMCLAPRHKVKICLSIMKKYAEEPIIINDRPLIIPADTKLGQPDASGIIRWSTLVPIDIEAAK